jgi:hypothetical protein
MTITTVNTEYLKPNVTIEQMVVSDMGETEMRYLINEKGQLYLYFMELTELIKYFSEGHGEHQIFYSEQEFEDFLNAQDYEIV